MLSSQFDLVDPNTIAIDREDRQRTKIEVEELKDSIRRIGVIHPIVVTREFKIVAGERRLQACKELEISVPIRFVDTLSTIELSIIELEENVKRSDLDWKDRIKAIGRIHTLYGELEQDWTAEKTATQIGVDKGSLSHMLQVYKSLDDPKVAAATGWRPAYNAISRVNSRIIDAAVTQLIEESSKVFAPPPTPNADEEPVSSTPVVPTFIPPIIQGNFLEWAPTYTGPKFNLLHCDFPYGINVFAGPQGRMSQHGLYKDNPDVYWELLECLISSADNLLGAHCHVVFWFSMDFYTDTKIALEEKFIVNPKPLIWLKSDNLGVAPDPRRGPRQIYETAFLAYRGDRPIVKVVSNGYSGPSDKSIHPSAKPEPMLRHFLPMLIDGTTRMLDPTAGGGSAIRVAQELGAEFVMGMELDKEHVENSNAACRKAWVLRSVKNGQ